MNKSVNEAGLIEVSHYGPVTALKLLGNILLVGYGPVLRTFRLLKDSCTHLSLQRVFRRNKIHSIATDTSGCIAVCGSRSFAVFRPGTGEPAEKALNEWIIAIAFVDADTVALLNSHNQVILFRIDNANRPGCTLLQTVHCGEKSLLYSGSIHKSPLGEVCIAAGTVMDGVIIWNLNTRKVIHRLKEHEGSIFAVVIDDLSLYIVSCSDDRSVKAYDFSSGRLLASGWGHGSRVWSLLFGTVSDAFLVVSMGEDCSTRVWEYNGSLSLVCAAKFEYCHEGKHIWSGDADFSGVKALVTGGADGKVRLWDIDSNSVKLHKHTAEAIGASSSVIFEKKESIRLFVQLPSVNLAVLVTTSGRMYFHQEPLSWTCMNASSASQDFFVLVGFAECNSVAAVTKTGRVMLVYFQRNALAPTQLACIDPDTPFKCINALSSTAGSSMYIFLDSPARDSPFVLHEIQIKDGRLQRRSTRLLPKPRDFDLRPTTFYYDSVSLKLFVGSRHANLAVYHLSQNSGDCAPQIFRKICPGDTVTSISTVPSDNGVVAIFTVRDGVYLYIRFTGTERALQHEIIHQNKFNRGTVEGAFVLDSQLFLLGFRSSSFYLWNETKQIEVLNVSCGGAHRQWEFLQQYQRNPGQCHFAYLTKASLVAVTITHRFGVANLGLVTTGTHGREIRSVAISPHLSSGGTRLLATVSEDATVKFGTINSSGNISYKWTMNNHISGLQSVKFVSKDYCISSAANEDLIVWKVDQYHQDLFAVVERARIAVSGEHLDLRVMDFAAVATFSGFYVAAVFSNSTVRVFSLNTDSSEFMPLSQTTYSQCCLLNAEFFVCNHQTFLAVGSTDGFLTIWNVTNCLASGAAFSAPVVHQQLHQSAIKAFIIVAAELGQWDVLTGGDDNALIHLTLSIGPNSVKFLTQSFFETAASATITGIACAGEKRVFVTSVDQIVRVWDFRAELKCVAANYTTVADTGCCAVAQFGTMRLALAAGAGLSVFGLGNA